MKKYSVLTVGANGSTTEIKDFPDRESAVKYISDKGEGDYMLVLRRNDAKVSVTKE